MTPRAYAGAAIAVIALAGATVALSAAAHEQAAGSTLSRADSGWIAARRYLEARGGTVALADTPSGRSAGVLVIVFPWQRLESRADATAAERHLAGGGTVVFAYSGQRSWSEPEIASRLGMTYDEASGDPPLHPLRWREYESATVELSPEPASDRAPLLVPTPRRRPEPPSGATVSFRDDRGRPAVFTFDRHGGRVLVLPAAIFSNAFIEEAGNADFLESLVAGLGRQWSFDEYHHGLSGTASVPPGSAAGYALDLFLVQLALVYGLGVLAVSRRFGPVWSDPPVVAGSTTSFLRGLGTLHHRLGHHDDAADLLVVRARQLHPRIEIPDAIPGDTGAAGLLRLAQVVGRAQSGEETR